MKISNDKSGGPDILLSESKNSFEGVLQISAAAYGNMCKSNTSYETLRKDTRIFIILSKISRGLLLECSQHPVHFLMSPQLYLHNAKQ